MEKERKSQKAMKKSSKIMMHSNGYLTEFNLSEDEFNKLAEVK